MLSVILRTGTLTMAFAAAARVTSAAKTAFRPLAQVSAAVRAFSTELGVLPSGIDTRSDDYKVRHAALPRNALVQCT